MNANPPQGLNKAKCLPIDDIKVPDDDGRILDLEHLARLADSTETNGVIHPITVTSDGKLLAGRHRLAACRLLGYSEIPVHDGGRRAAGQERDGAKSFIANTAEKAGCHKDSIGRLARIGSRLDPLPPELNDHPITNRQNQLELLSNQTSEMQKDIVEDLISGNATTVTEALAARNGHHGEDAQRDEAELVPENPPAASEENQTQDGAAPSCSAKPDEGEEPQVTSSGESAPDDLPTGEGTPELRESETVRSKINTGLNYVRQLVDTLGGSENIVKELSDHLEALYRTYVNRNGCERPALPPIHSNLKD